MSTIAERLKEICNTYFKGNVSTMAAYYEIAQPSLFKYINDGVTVPYQLLHNIAVSGDYRVSCDWLLTGYGELAQKGSKSVLYEDRYLDIIHNLQMEIKEKQKTINILQEKLK